ncbi:HYDIN protein, partial [Ptilonorhynchus violaceus]|nr:HYDIN protein [Ptilonorhynchus violaceus]
QDYFHQLLCNTEKEQFIVPIRAIGARAVLDFPDQLDFSVCPVKHSTQKTLLVHNLGNRAAHYQISTQRPKFSLPAPSLGSGLHLAITVSGMSPSQLFLSVGSGWGLPAEYKRGVMLNLFLQVEVMSAHSAAHSAKSCDTFLLVIHNWSDVTARFQWKASAAQEGGSAEAECRRLCWQEKDKLNDFLKRHRVDTTRRERFALLSRILQSKRAKVQGDPLLFSSDIFSIEPMEGEVRPNCSAEISVFFKPQQARVYKQAVYCDVSGHETRLPLLLIGEGLGPQLHFNFEELDVGKVFVRAAHSYEAILFNNGPIEAPFSLIPPTTAVGSCFTFLPQEGIVAPDGLQVIRISFCPTVLGEFKE